MSSDRLPRGSIAFDGVTKRFPSAGRLPTRAPGALEDGPPALDGVDFRIEPGEQVGLIGPNGAGKSTILRLVAGVTAPTSGSVASVGRVRPMLELGVGFHPLLTGRENAKLTLQLLGVTATRSDLDDVIEFSGLGSRIDDAVRTYSVGMRARLGFAVASSGDMAILVADEILSVGDIDFQQRCVGRIAELASRGTTLLFVSHELPLVSQLCGRTIWLDGGRVRAIGPSSEIIRHYLSGSPTRVRADDGSPMAFDRVDLGATEIEPWSRFEISADIEVREPVGRPRLRLDLLIPDHAAGQVFASTTDALSEGPDPRSYRVTGTSSAFPGEASRIELVLSLLTPDGRVCDSVSQDVRISGGRGHGKPHLATIPTGSARWLGPGLPGESRVGPDHVAPVSAAWQDGASVVAERVTKWYGRGGRRPTDAAAALTDVSIAFAAGSVTGLIGSNGAGKSTLLRLLAGVTHPDEGRIRTSGRVVPMLELGIGFNPDLTGRENALVSGRLLGMSRDEIRSRLDRIAELFGMAHRFDDHLRTYSSGMRARLGFALAIAADADVLLIDEVLSIGDEEFRRAAIGFIRSARDRGAAIVLVSHELRLVEMMADRAVRLEAGRIVDDGEPADVIARYGGSSQSAGVNHVRGAVRVGEVSVGRSVVALGDVVEFRTNVHVERPSPDVHLEVAYRIIPEDRHAPLDDQTLLDLTFLQARLDLGRGPFERAGSYEVQGRIGDNIVEGAFDLVVTAVDTTDGDLLSESWHQLIVGTARSRPGPVLEMAWHHRTGSDL